jgi:hypothetical protein
MKKTMFRDLIIIDDIIFPWPDVQYEYTQHCCLNTSKSQLGYTLRDGSCIKRRKWAILPKLDACTTKNRDRQTLYTWALIWDSFEYFLVVNHVHQTQYQEPTRPNHHWQDGFIRSMTWTKMIGQLTRSTSCLNDPKPTTSQCPLTQHASMSYQLYQQTHRLKFTSLSPSYFFFTSILTSLF